MGQLIDGVPATNRLEVVVVDKMAGDECNVAGLLQCQLRYRRLTVLRQTRQRTARSVLPASLPHSKQREHSSIVHLFKPDR